MSKKAELTEQNSDSVHLTDVPGDANKRQKLLKLQHSLTTRLKAGDRSAAEEFVDMYHEQIYLFMRRLGHDRQVSHL